MISNNGITTSRRRRGRWGAGRIGSDRCRLARIAVDWWYSGQHHFLLDQWRSQCEYGELWDAYKTFCNRYSVALAFIERAANGYPLIRESQRRRKNVRVVGITTERRSKTARLAPHVQKIRAGLIKLPVDGKFINDYLAEITASKPAFFDQIDSTVQYLDGMVDQPPLQPPPPRALGVAYNSRGRINPDRGIATHVWRNRR
jgi:hypothetical protein